MIPEGLLTFVGNASFGVVAVALLLVGLSTWVWMLHAWTEPAVFDHTGALDPDLPHEPCATFSLLVPARREERVLGATLERLANLRHPWYEVVAVVGDDDGGTRHVAEAAAARWPGRIRVVVDASVPKSKPRALNAGLAECRGKIVGIFDAEDDVHPEILLQADAVFERTGAQVAQGGVQLTTLRARWFSLRNCLEYLFWFRSRLHAHLAHGFAPLGGNTVFFRRRLLVAAGGWDGDCLAEDCDIGIRLSSAGARVSVWYDPRTSTREETPGSLRAFVRQRTRWNQGYLQVLRHRSWKALPTRRQRLVAQYVLVFPLVQATTGLLLPASIALIAVGRLPLLLTLAAFAPLLVMVCVLVTEMVGLAELSRSFSLPIGWRDYVRLALTTIPYQVVLAFAGVRAAYRELRHQGGWEKTAHHGSHREPACALATEG